MAVQLATSSVSVVLLLLRPELLQLFPVLVQLLQRPLHRLEQLRQLLPLALPQATARTALEEGPTLLRFSFSSFLLFKSRKAFLAFLMRAMTWTERGDVSCGLGEGVFVRVVEEAGLGEDAVEVEGRSGRAPRWDVWGS